MSRTQGALIAIASVALSASVVIAQQAAPGANMPVPPGVPEWAYNTPPPPPGSPPPPTALPADDNAVVKIAGTEKTMTRGALRGVKEIPDWYPEDRQGQMPSIVRVGKEGARACGFCHLADGSGRPENAPVSAYHPAYFRQQMEDFKNGLRRSADPRKGNTWNMIGFAKAMTPEEVNAAAEYFAAQPYPRRMKVVESKTAPKIRLQGGMHMKIPDNEGGGMEPIGDHIVEIPDDNLRSEARDTRMGWTAYVPPGTLNKGKQLAAKNNCSVCHGSNLEGVGPIPALAGRSPSYTVRQLFDMKTGTRRGPWSEVMKPIVNNLSTQDMMALAAYAASVAPPATGVRSTR
jgi:cytochrome c553